VTATNARTLVGGLKNVFRVTIRTPEGDKVMHRVTHLVDADKVVDDLLLSRRSEGEKRFVWLDWAFDEREKGRWKVAKPDGSGYRDLVSVVRLNRCALTLAEAEEWRMDCIQTFNHDKAELLDDRMVDALNEAKDG
jgi:hypothetical protein